jgi:hypothetical protein
MNNSQVPDRLNDYVLNVGAYYLWIINTELTSCHPSGALIFGVACRFLEILYTHELKEIKIVFANLTVQSDLLETI